MPNRSQEIHSKFERTGVRHGCFRSVAQDVQCCRSLCKKGDFLPLLNCAREGARELLRISQSRVSPPHPDFVHLRFRSRNRRSCIDAAGSRRPAMTSCWTGVGFSSSYIGICADKVMPRAAVRTASQTVGRKRFPAPRSCGPGGCRHWKLGASAVSNPMRCFRNLARCGVSSPAPVLCAGPFRSSVLH